MQTGFHKLLIAVFFISFLLPCRAQHAKSAETDEFEAYPIDIAEQLKVFQKTIPGAIYRIALCADVPNNAKPLQVAHNQETGHVFLILQMIYGSDTTSEVFGFYPKRGLPVLFIKTIASKIKDNSRRDYDVEISKTITEAEFDEAILKAVFYGKKKYHINRFNCYDYAMTVFNAVAGNDPLPVVHVRYPFVFGKGGSPCGVYRDLKRLKETDAAWAPYIHFGELIAPISTGRNRGGEVK
jgi:hypothetical protein